MRLGIGKWVLGASIWMVAGAGWAEAGPINPRYIPPDAKWVVHVDMDTLTRSKLWTMLYVNFDLNVFRPNQHISLGVSTSKPADDAIRRKIDAFADALNMKFPEDIHDMTLVGRDFDQSGAVLLVHAKMDRDRLIGLAKISPQYVSEMHGGVEISNLKDQSISGAFLSDDVLALGQKTEVVEKEIDLAQMQGNQPASSLMAAGKGVSDQGAGVMVYLAAKGLAELQQEEDLSPIFAPVTRVRASLSEQGEDLMLTAALDVKTAELARQVRGALEGIKSLALLAQGTSDEANVIITLAQRATSTVDETTVVVHWPVAMSVIEKTMADAMTPHEKKHANVQATTQPASAEQK